MESNYNHSLSPTLFHFIIGMKILEEKPKNHYKTLRKEHLTVHGNCEMTGGSLLSLIVIISF